MEENSMLEQTNPAQSTEEIEDEDFVGEFFSEEPEQPAGDEAQPQAQEEKLPQEERTFRVKYNGREVELPENEITAYAQKGMNYDHVYEELQSLRSAREFQILDAYAAQAGMNRQSYLELLEQQIQEARVAEQTAQGVPEEVARKLTYLEQKEQEREREQAERERRELRNQQFLELAREYPGITELPQEVVDAIGAGETPLNAYRAYELTRLKQKLSIYEKNQENRAKTPGSAAGELPGEEQDEFMSGFSSVL